MAKSKEAKRLYDASDLKELMDNCGGWAKTWDHVLRYLHGPAVYDADFAKDEVPSLIHDVEVVKQREIPFTTDYRDLWKEITGNEDKDLPEPEGMGEPATNPIELEDKYLKRLEFPATKSQVLEKARSNRTPKRVMGILHQLEDDRYENLGTLLEAIGDLAWDHD